ncbi:MAG: aldehyde dehydrogenase family protein [Ilumatobacteraceae bacterium]
MAPAPVALDTPFHNAADTDWARAANRRWIAAALASPPAVDVSVLDTIEQIDAVVETARSSSWHDASVAERRRLLHAAADVMERGRARTTLALMAHDAAKTVAEGDPEVSEAIDFARWAAVTIPGAGEVPLPAGARFEPLGTVVVASPWNFRTRSPPVVCAPRSPPGTAAILKPAPEVRTVALHLARQLWAAGVPVDALQYVACPDDEVGRRLVTHPDVDAVVLTGALETAEHFLDWRPSMRLFAETSGKNAIVITGAADEDLAIRDLCGRRSGTPARSARPPASRSSKPRCTTTSASGADWPMPCAASVSGRRPISRR